MHDASTLPSPGEKAVTLLPYRSVAASFSYLIEVCSKDWPWFILAPHTAAVLSCLATQRWIIADGAIVMDSRHVDSVVLYYGAYKAQFDVWASVRTLWVKLRGPGRERRLICNPHTLSLSWPSQTRPRRPPVRSPVFPLSLLGVRGHCSCSSSNSGQCGPGLCPAR